MPPLVHTGNLHINVCSLSSEDILNTENNCTINKYKPIGKILTPLDNSTDEIKNQLL